MQSKRIYKKSGDGKKWAKKTPYVPKISTYLIIVESPSKCGKIESYLGSEYTCIASKGHLRTIAGLKSIDENYNVVYNTCDDKKDHIVWLKDIISKFEPKNIFLATDDDREGEAIAWHICDLFQLPVETTKRIIFHEITQPAILAAMQSPTVINMNIVKAQQSRQVLDLLVGYKVSPILWKYLFYNKENSLSAGRCQTPALRIVYDNSKEPRILEKTYKIAGIFSGKKIQFDLTKEMDTGEQALKFLEESKSFQHKLSIGVKKTITYAPPAPFNTSALLQSASSILSMSPKETMSVCQQLYQEGYITYMRTESKKYSGVFLEDCVKYISGKYKAEYVGDIAAVENTDSGNPHEAIRPTHIEQETITSENRRAVALYKLIWKNTMESCMAIAKYEQTPVYITAPMEYEYRYVVEVPLFLGWKRLDAKTSVEEVQSMGAGLLLYFTAIAKAGHKESIPYIEIQATVAIHGRHSHYTEASLIKKLETMGIGRPSTFATIVETIMERGYVVKTDIAGESVVADEYVLNSSGVIEVENKTRIFGAEKGKLVIQPVGILVAEFLSENFRDLFAYDYTKKMEDDLDGIAQGDAENTICAQCCDDIEKYSKALKQLGKQEFPVANSEYSVVFEKYGPALRKVLSDGSYEYKKVKSMLSIDVLKSGSLEELMEEEEERGNIDGVEIVIKNGRFGKYVQYGEKNIGIKSLGLAEDASMTDIAAALASPTPTCKKEDVLRFLTPEISVRNGKYGAYIHHQTKDMKKPAFYNIKKFKESYRYCAEDVLLAWIKETYNIG